MIDEMGDFGDLYQRLPNGDYSIQNELLQKQEAFTAEAEQLKALLKKLGYSETEVENLLLGEKQTRARRCLARVIFCFP